MTLQRKLPVESPTWVKNFWVSMFFSAALGLTKDKIFDLGVKSSRTSLAFSIFEYSATFLIIISAALSRLNWKSAVEIDGNARVRISSRETWLWQKAADLSAWKYHVLMECFPYLCRGNHFSCGPTSTDFSTGRCIKWCSKGLLQVPRETNRNRVCEVSVNNPYFHSLHSTNYPQSKHT